jgi:hypothetical protein
LGFAPRATTTLTKGWTAAPQAEAEAFKRGGSPSRGQLGDRRKNMLSGSGGRSALLSGSDGGAAAALASLQPEGARAAGAGGAGEEEGEPESTTLEEIAIRMGLEDPQARERRLQAAEQAAEQRRQGMQEEEVMELFRQVS